MASYPPQSKNFTESLFLNISFNQLFMNLFRKILFCLFFLLCISPVFSQEISFRGGLNISQMAENVIGDSFFDDSKLKPGFHFGPTFSFRLIRPLEFETGIFYSLKGMRKKGKSGFDREITYLEKVNLSYLEIPADIKIKIFERNLSLYGYCGGYLGYALSGSIYGNPDISKDEVFRTKITWEKGSEYPLKRLDYGTNIGFEIAKNNSTIGINFLLGLKNLTYIGIPYFNKTIEIYIKYRLWSRKL